MTVVSPAPGGGASAAATFTVTAPTSLTVSATSSAPGGSVTATADQRRRWTDGVARAGFDDGAKHQLPAVRVRGPRRHDANLDRRHAGNARQLRIPLLPDRGRTRGRRRARVSRCRRALSPAPVVTSLAPAAIAAGSAEFTLTVRGSGFAASSIVRWNGTDRPTTFVSATELRASVAAADVALPGTATVTVFSPAPGGGTSSPLTLTITLPPILAVSAATVPAGANVTMTLTNGSGGSSDWLAFAPAARRTRPTCSSPTLAPG